MKCLLIFLSVLLISTKGECQYWKALGGGTTFGPIGELQPDTFHNKLFVGGNFTDMGNTDAQYLAVWDGSEWIKVNPTLINPVTGFAMKEDTLFYVTGIANDQQVGMFVDTSFIGYLPKVGNIANCLYVFNDTLYVGGSFNGEIKYWDGSQWNIFGGGVGGLFGQVLCIGSYNNQLIVGGQFSDADGVTVNNIAEWDGSEWNDMGGGVTYPGGTPQVKAMQQFQSKLFVGGSFMYAGSIHTRENAIWDGISWDTLAVPEHWGLLRRNKGLYANDSMLYATGTIAGCCGCPGDRAGMFDGETWYDMYLNDGDGGYAITVFDGEVIAGTDFKYGWNNDTVNYVARFLGYPTEVSSIKNIRSQLIYPSPASTTIQIHLPSNQSTTLSIFNLLGEKVKEEKVNGKEVTLDVSELPAGFYVVKAEQKMLGKFLKEE